MAELGIEPSFALFETNNAVAGPSKLPAGATGKRKRTLTAKAHRVVRDRSGYIVSLPPPGEIQRMACVQIPSDRRLRRLIAEGAYTDCSDWSEGEQRRWRWGLGLASGADLAEDERPVVGGVAPDFRWRRWRGLRKELAAERDGLEGREQADRGDILAHPAPADGVSAYSVSLDAFFAD